MPDNRDTEDYEALVEDNFSPTNFANDLLIATNSTRSELDISTAIKRVKFDINNIDLELEKISAEDHESLIKGIHNDMAKKDFFAQLNSPLDHINTSYQRLEKDLLNPYNKAIKTQEVLKKIHTTSFLLRSVTHFLYLTQQIGELQSSPALEQTATKSPKILLKLANLHNQFKRLISDNPNLKSLKIIRDYDPIGLEKQRQLMDLIQSQIRSISDKNIYSAPESTIRYYFLALYALDSRTLVDSVSTLLSNNVIMSVNSLTRVLTSPRNMNGALEEVLKKANLITKISQILKETHTENNKKLLLDEVLQSMDISNLLSSFWRDVAKKFEPKFRETMLRGGPVAKSLISYKDQIRASIKRTVLSSDESLNPEGVEAKMMLNSVASLDRTR
jgi:hypothetical protein